MIIYILGFGGYMEDIIFRDLIQIVDCFYGSKFLGSGREGKCYKIGDKTYKFYNFSYCDLLDNVDSKSKLLKFRDLFIDNIYFIRALIFYDDLLVGSVTDYASGKSCDSVNLHRCNIKKLIEALANLKKSLYELSEVGIYVEDVFFSNILYDGNRFKLIDTSGYLYSTEIGEYEHSDKDDILVIYEENMKSVIGELFRGITDKKYKNDNFIYSFLQEINSPYKDYLVDRDLLMYPDETIIGIRNIVCEYIGREIYSFSSCRGDLMKIRGRW